MPDEALLQRPGTPRAAGRREVLVVVAIALSQTAGIQLGKVVVKVFSAAFLVWFGTSFNVLLLIPFVLLRGKGALHTTAHRADESSWPWRAAFAAPFFGLWLGANFTYTLSLLSLPPPVVSALFSITPSLVALLSVPMLHRRLTLLAVCACCLSAAGVVLISHPWKRDASSFPNGTASAGSGTNLSSRGMDGEEDSTHASTSSGDDSSPSVGALYVVAAACCAATYKVLFRRWHNDAHVSAVFFVLGMIGVYTLVLGTPLLLVVDPSAFAALNGSTAALEDSSGRDHGGVPPAMWAATICRAALDLAFNYFIAYGISLIHPLFISVGTLLSTPLNVLATFAIDSTVPSAAEWGGIVAVLCGFAVLLLDERRTSDAADARASTYLADGTQADGSSHQPCVLDDESGREPGTRQSVNSTTEAAPVQSSM